LEFHQFTTLPSDLRAAYELDVGIISSTHEESSVDTDELSQPANEDHHVTTLPSDLRAA